MAAVLNRITKQFIPIANTPDYPPAEWIINPDLSAVTGFATKYWLITGDVVTLMNQAARDAVDAAERVALLDAAASAAVASIAVGGDSDGFLLRGLIHLMNQRDNFLVNRIIQIQDALTAAKATSGGADNIRNAIPASWLATQTRTRQDAITDLRGFIRTLENGE